MANLNLKFLRGLQNALPTTGTDGYFYLTTDTHRLYTSIDGKVVPVNEGVTTVANLDALTAVTGAKAGDFFYCTEENILTVFNGQNFVQINPDTGATSVEVVGEGNAVTAASYDADTRKLTLTKGETFATKGELDALAGKVGEVPEGSTVMGIITNIQENAYDDTELRGIIDGKVDKVEGKGLSTNDLTDELKGQYDAAYQHSLVDHAPANAQENVIESVKVNGTALEIKDKAVDITVPTGALAGKDEVAKDDLAEALATEIDNKVAKEDGKSLVLDTEISKLAGVSEGANKVEASENGKIKIDGQDVTVYEHPEKHAIADVTGLQDALDGLQVKGDYAAEEHTHTKDEITDFAHTHVAADITDLDATIKGYDYATKTELGDVDKKFANYVTSESYGVDKKATEDAVADRYTKSEADEKFAIKGADAYDDTELSNRVKAIEDDYLKGEHKTAIEGLITAEKERAEGIEGGLRTDVDVIKGDYLKASDKTELEGKITTNANAIERLTNGVSAEEIDGVNDLINYVKEHGAEVTGMQEDIAANAKAIEDAKVETANQDAVVLAEAQAYADAELAKKVDKVEGYSLVADTEIARLAEVKNYDDTALVGRVATLEGIDHDAYIAADSTLKTELEGKISDGDAATLEAAKLDAANKVTVVLADAQKYTNDAIATVEGKVTELSGKVYTKEEVDAAVASAVEAQASWGEF